MRSGLTGVTPAGDALGFSATSGPAGLPVVFLAAWLAAGALAAKRCFRWEPRR